VVADALSRCLRSWDEREGEDSVKDFSSSTANGVVGMDLGLVSEDCEDNNSPIPTDVGGGNLQVSSIEFKDRMAEDKALETGAVAEDAAEMVDILPFSKEVDDEIAFKQRAHDRLYCFKFEETPDFVVDRVAIAKDLNEKRRSTESIADSLDFSPCEPELVLDESRSQHELRHGILPEDHNLLSVGQKIAKFHNAVVGHHGIRATCNLMREKGWTFPDMTDTIKDFIGKCVVCQKVRLGKGSQEASSKSTMIEEPFHTVAVDTIGPLPEDDNGMKYIIVAVDCFSRFCELKATRTVTAREAADFLLEIAGRWGAPKFVRTDNGPQFSAAVVENLLTFLGPMHDCTVPYRHESNGIVERLNSEVGRHLRAIVFERKIKGSWSHALPIVQRIINSSYHSAVGTEPCRLLLGDSISLNRGLLNSHNKRPRATVEDYILDLKEVQDDAISFSIDFQKKAINKRVKVVQDNSIDANDYVLIKLKDRPMDKLSAKWRGPMVVVEAIPDKCTIKVQDLLDKSVHIVHRSVIKKCNLSALDNAKAIAATDIGQWPVEKIVEHQGTRLRNNKSNLKFRVRWEGFSEQEDEWLPRDEVKHLDVFKEYVEAHPNANL
jgi:hypothetical protein